MEFQNESRAIINDFFAQKKKKSLNITVIIFIAAALVSLVCLIAFANVPKPEPTLMSLETKKGEYCKITVADIDLAATSDTEGYYYILDNNGYLGIIMTSPIELTGELMDVYNDTTGTITATVTGIASDIPADLINFAISDFELQNNDEFNEYFGYYLLDTTRYYSNTGFGIALLCSFVSITAVIILGITLLIERFKKKNAISRIESSGELDQIAREMRSYGNYSIENSDSCAIITTNYLISNEGYIIKLSDILWCYKQTRKVNGISINAGLTLACRKKKSYFILGTLPNQANNDKILEIVNLLKDRLPSLLIGYTRENKKAYKQKLKDNTESQSE